MRVTVVRPDDIGPSEASLWTTYQRASRLTNSPFYSLTFAKVVAQFRPNARIAVVEDDGKIQAFLPFELRAAKTAVPIGHPMNDLQGFISSGAMFDARLATECGWPVRMAVYSCASGTACSSPSSLPRDDDRGADSRPERRLRALR